MEQKATVKQASAALKSRQLSVELAGHVSMCLIKRTNTVLALPPLRSPRRQLFVSKLLAIQTQFATVQVVQLEQLLNLLASPTSTVVVMLPLAAAGLLWQSTKHRLMQVVSQTPLILLVEEAARRLSPLPHPVILA